MYILKILIMIVLLFGCSRKENSQEIMVYRKAVYSIPDQIDIIKMNDTSQFSIANIIFEGLFTVDKLLMVRPVLVDNWKIENEGMAYTFFLKKNIYFHDGNSVDSQ